MAGQTGKYKLIQIREVDKHLMNMFEGWNKDYLNYPTLWDAIERYHINDQIGGDRGFILTIDTVPKPDYHAIRNTAILLNKRVVEDMEILKQLGISLQITYYSIKDDNEHDFKVVACMIPEWMLGMKKEDILKEYENNG